MVRILFLYVFILSVVSVSAYDIEVKDLRYLLDVESSTLSFCGVAPSYSFTSLVIPDSVSYNGRWLPVVSIEKNAFPNGYRPVTSVTIPASVREIKPEAFPYGCPLIKVTIADADTPLKVGYAYEGALLSYKQEEGDGTFHFCTKLEEVYIGRDLDYEGFDSLKYGFGPFYRSVVKSVVFGDSVKMIQDKMFWNAPSLTELSISSSVSYIGKDALYFSPIQSPFILPDSLSVIEHGVFSSSDFSIIDLSSKTLVGIGERSFMGSDISKRPKKLLLGPSIRSIGKNAFARQKGISEIYCYSAEPPVIDAEISTEFVPSNVYADAVLHVPAGSAAKYAEAPIWCLFWSVVEMEDADVDIVDLSHDPFVVYVLDAKGRRLPRLEKGLNIVVYSDGNSRKIILK